ncbi:MAG: glycoside hydrolase family protein [Hyphomonadaceae bacterium]
MTSRLRTSRAGLDLVKSFEGFRETSVRLPDGRWTVGYGHVRTAREGLTISEKDAEDLLVFDLKPAEEAIRTQVLAPLNQNQFDALVSLVFNISPGQFKDSAILRYLNSGDYLAAALGFDAWRKARINGQVMIVDALIRRRAAEKALFLEHPDGRPVVPTPMVTPELDVTGVGQLAVESRGAATTSSVGSVPEAHRPRPDEPDIAQAISEMAASQSPPVLRKPQFPGATAVEQPSTRPDKAPEKDGRSNEPNVLEEASRIASERIAKILSRADAPIAPMTPPEPSNSNQVEASSRPEPRSEPSDTPPGPAKSRTVAAAVRPAARVATIPDELPDFDAPRPLRTRPEEPASSPGQPLARAPEAADQDADRKVLIDDTEVFDPGRAPEDIFAEAVRNEAIVNGRATRGEVLVRLAPWIAIFLISAPLFGVGLFELLGAGGSKMAPVLVVVFGLLLAASVYFLATRRHAGPGGSPEPGI